MTEITGLFDELNDLIELLEKSGIEYAVCGGLALAIHGFPRATFDIDILIKPESLEKAYEIVAGKGYDIRGLDMSFKEEPLKFGVFLKLTAMVKCFRLIFYWLRRKLKMFGKQRKNTIGKVKICGSCRVKV